LVLLTLAGGNAGYVMADMTQRHAVDFRPVPGLNAPAGPLTAATRLHCHVTGLWLTTLTTGMGLT